MLVSNSVLNNNDVVALRLITGEEVIGKLVSSTALSYAIAKPIIVQMRMVNPQEAGIAFAPYAVAMDEKETVEFFTAALLSKPGKARSDLAAQYIAATTGIAIPKSGLVGGL